MADTLTTQSSTLATVPASSIIATDDAGASGHVQIVKLALSTDGSATPITADANGLEVQGAGAAGTPAGGVVSIQGVASGTVVPVSDGGGALTVDGTVGVSGTVTVDGSGVTQPVSAASLPLPTGAATLAEQQDQTTALELIDDAIYTDDVPFTAGANKVMAAGFRYDDVTPDTVQQGDVGYARMSSRRELFVAVRDAAGNERGMNIDASGNPTVNVTGTVTVGSHAVTNAGTFATQVDGAALSALQLLDDVVLTEDAAHGSGDKGVMSLAVRRDANTTLADATGDYAPLQVDASGSLKVAIISGAGSGGTAMVDDAAFTAATTSFTPSGGIVTADSVDAGDGGAFAMLANRQQKVTLYDSSGVEASVGGGTQYDEDTASADAQKLTMAGVTRADTAASQVGTDGDRSTLIVDASGRLHTNVGNTVTVSGTVTANAGTGTLAVSLASVPSHAVTNAGTFATQVDGAALTALQLLDDPVQVLGTDTYTEATSKGVTIGAVRRDADTTLVNTTNEFGPLQMDANGRLKVEAFSGETLPVSLTSTTVTGTVAVTQSGAWDEVGINDSGNSITVDNGGTFAVQVDGAALTALQLIDDQIKVDDAAFTPGTSSVAMAGFQADEASIDSVDEGDAGAARMTLDRKVIVQPQPHTAGGLSIFRSLDLDETEEEVKASAGQVYGLWFTNTAAATRWLKFYNATAANVTVGTTTPVLTLGLPGNTADEISGVFSSAMGITFDTAITVAATTAVADNDTGAPAANDVIVNIFYK